MRSLALLLHFYQPPTQSGSITEQVLQSCYLPLADLLLSYPQARFTINIAAFPNEAFISKIKILLDRGQVELCNSPIYHPLLPLLDSSEIPQLLEANRKLLKDAFGIEPVNVIYPPELAASPTILAALETYTKDQRPLNSGVNIIIDESSVNPDFSLDKIPQLPPNVSSRSVCEFLRSYPNELTAEKFFKFFEPRTTENQIVTAVADAELFGHHYTERINLLRELLESKRIQLVKLTELDDRWLKIENSGRKSRIENRNVNLQSSSFNPPAGGLSSIVHHLSPKDFIASSWQTSAANLKNDNPYPLWLSNNLQKKYDELAKLTYQLTTKSPDPNLPADDHYRRGISSCHYYWLSNWPWWHPDLVEMGARELIKCVRSLYIDTGAKLPAEKLYHNFLMEMWSYHWSGEVEKKWQEYNEARNKFLDEHYI